MAVGTPAVPIRTVPLPALHTPHPPRLERTLSLPVPAALPCQATKSFSKWRVSGKLSVTTAPEVGSCFSPLDLQRV